MNARDAILGALRAIRTEPVAAPAHPTPVALPDPVGRFLESVKGVGGQSYRVPDAAALAAAVAALPVWSSPRRASLVDGIPGTVFPQAVADPHELASLDVAAIPAELGVAENGAVWVKGETLGRHRAIFVIPEHLVLVLRAETIVNDMQAAYARITLPRPGYGLFISGPSKTADIEQSLVIGAHGARSCAVFVVG
ncbi:MAG: LUD domain-containing protein [Anaeromyxobacteraceae bacterium]